MSDNKVRVCIRSRPPGPSEGRAKRAISIQRDRVIVGDKIFPFDAAFDEKITQSEIFNSCIEKLIEGCFEGYNATVFAYGQTGSGKTYSMVGNNISDDDIGIIPRSLQYIFTRLKQKKEEGMSIINLKISFLEIYNDEVNDLLHSEVNPRDIMIREDKEGRIFFTGARDEIISSIEEAIYFLDFGARARTTAETFMNASSSRSHAIFTISMELLAFSGKLKAEAGAGPGAGAFIQSKLHLVDLAGSERAKRTMATGTRLKESVGINQGLLALGKVIRALTAPSTTSAKSGQTINAHVPYRDSKLTRFLQDALGGNSRTVMLACISPMELDLHETLNTIAYATRARAVQNKAVANIIATDDDEMHGLMAGGAGGLVSSDLEQGIVDALRSQLRQMELEMEKIKAGQETLSSLGIAGNHNANSNQMIAVGSGDLSPTRSGTNNRSQIAPGLLKAIDMAKSLLAELGQVFDQGGRSLDRAMAGDFCDRCRFVGQLLSTNSQPLPLSRAPLPPRDAVGSSLRRSIADEFAATAQAEEIRILRQELEECREDLRRDEEIFGEKVRELKKTRKAVKSLEEENDALMKKLESYQAKSAPFGGRNALDEGDANDMDLSIAVVATEPDISQLMEDLETLTKEKEKLQDDRQQVEIKYDLVNKQAEQEIASYKDRQQSLHRKLSELETNISQKQQQINGLEASRTSARDQMARLEARTKELEEEKEALRKQLHAIDMSGKQTRAEVEQERNRRIENEEQLQQAEAQLKQLRAQQERQRKEEASSKHLDELTALRAEYAKLTALVEQDEFKQRKTLESLTLQVSNYRRRATESQAQMKDLEDKNADLRTRLERMLKINSRGHGTANTTPATPTSGQSNGPMSARKGKDASGNIQDTDLVAADGMEGDDLSYQPQSARKQTVSSSKKSIGSSQPPPPPSSLAAGTNSTDGTKQTVTAAPNKEHKEIQIDWNRAGKWVNDRVIGKLAELELLKLKDKQVILQKDKSELERELQSLAHQQRDQEFKLSKQIDETNAKMAKYINAMKKSKTKVTQLTNTLSQSDSESPEAQLMKVELAHEKEKLASCVQSLKNHQDYVDELQQRVEAGGLSSELSSKYQDMQDELATVQAEIELNEVRLKEENQKIRRTAGSTVGSSSSSSSSSSSKKAGSKDIIPGDTFLSYIADTAGVDVQGAEEVSPDVFKELLNGLTQQLIDLKYRQCVENGSSKDLQQQLEAKESELEEIQINSAKIRNEYLRRQEQMKRESDDKISFLLQQLRSTESKLNSSQILQNASTSILSSTPAKPNNLNPFSRPQSASDNHLGSGFARLSDDGLSRESLEIIHMPHVDNNELFQKQQQQKEEIIRRWQSEKERREQLEKKNSELSRELRSLRAQVQANT